MRASTRATIFIGLVLLLLVALNERRSPKKRPFINQAAAVGVTTQPPRMNQRRSSTADPLLQSSAARAAAAAAAAATKPANSSVPARIDVAAKATAVASASSGTAAAADTANPLAKADPSCNPTLHAGFSGGSLNWGMSFKVATAAECCAACKAHAEVCTGQGNAGKVYWQRTWQGKTTEERCQGTMSSNATQHAALSLKSSAVALRLHLREARECIERRFGSFGEWSARAAARHYLRCLASISRTHLRSKRVHVSAVPPLPTSVSDRCSASLRSSSVAL